MTENSKQKNDNFIAIVNKDTAKEDKEEMIKASEDKLKSVTVKIGPMINCDEVDAIITKNNYVCISCNKKNPKLIIISSTGGVVFGSFLGNSCCCISTVSKTTVLTTVAFALLAFAAVIGGILAG